MSAFGRLTGTFSSLAAATMLFATPACAQSEPGFTRVANSNSPTELTEEAVDELIGPAVSRRDAFRASTDSIVYLVGDGIVGVEGDVLALRDMGYRVAAFQGGETGKVECFVARMPCGEYNQSQIFDSTMSGTAAVLYNERLGEPSARRTSLASLNR